MIQKVSKPYITKLRIVQLYEADFNTMLKHLMGKILMAHSEIYGLNGNQLYKSRKGCLTYEALITVRVIYDMARAQRSYLVSMFNDLKGYYDRVRPALNTVTTRRMGLPRNAAVCHAQTLRKMEHHVKTSFGISEDTLKWCRECNPGGLGQGNGAGCVSWHSHMLVLEEAYEKSTSNTVEFGNPDSMGKFRQWLVGFVDDNSLLFSFKNLGYDEPAVKLIKEAKNSREKWQRLVHISGGELELTKSSYSVMAWKLAEGKEKLCSIADAPGTLMLRSETYKSMEVEVTRNEVHSAERQLGV